MAEPRLPPNGQDDDFWRKYLTNGDGPEHTLRRLLHFIPDNPRCSACAAPFAGVGAPVMRLIGKRRSDHNPKLCNSCFDYMKELAGFAMPVEARRTIALKGKSEPIDIIVAN